jgi:hypothetical protein
MGAQAVFSSTQREITIRRDEADRVYVQIYRPRFLWDLLSKETAGVNVFELARRKPFSKEIPVQATGSDYLSILRANAEFMQECLSDLIDGSAWVKG